MISHATPLKPVRNRRAAARPPHGSRGAAVLTSKPTLNPLPSRWLPVPSSRTKRTASATGSQVTSEAAKVAISNQGIGGNTVTSGAHLRRNHHPVRRQRLLYRGTRERP